MFRNLCVECNGKAISMLALDPAEEKGGSRTQLLTKGRRPCGGCRLPMNGLLYPHGARPCVARASGIGESALVCDAD
jgi:hypothetical protein